MIQAAVENARSRAIPERLGFREEGILREVERIGDRMLDDVVYAMLAADWPGASCTPRRLRSPARPLRRFAGRSPRESSRSARAVPASG